MKIELTNREADVLIELLNVACKAVGLQGAESCLVLAGKIEAAKNAENAETPDNMDDDA